jgi:hypothetical protein
MTAWGFTGRRKRADADPGRKPGPFSTLIPQYKDWNPLQMIGMIMQTRIIPMEV